MEKKKNLLSKCGEIGLFAFAGVVYLTFSMIENKVYKLKKKRFDRLGIGYQEWRDTDGFYHIQGKDKISNY